MCWPVTWPTISVPPSAANRIAPGHPGGALVETRCLGCHDGRLIQQQRLSVDGWRREIDKMRGWGAPVTDVEKETLAEYLAAALFIVGARRDGLAGGP